MRRIQMFLWSFLFLLISNYAYSQYFISGALGPAFKNKKIYFSLLRYDEQSSMSKEQNLFSTTTDSLGNYSFTGKLLAKEAKLYRIHANIQEGTTGFDFADVDELKNFHNFIFSNSDTIVFDQKEGQWFLPVKNTNKVDQEWRVLKRYKRKLLKEFSEIKNKEARVQTLSQLLSELKAYLQKNQTNPLIKLILLSEIDATILNKDFETDADFYFQLQEELKTMFAKKSYTLQFEELLADLSMSATQEALAFYKKLVYGLLVVVLILVISVVLLWRQLKVAKQAAPPKSTPLAVHLTNQEEKIAKLILEEKTNKEIAAELFISLSTVKTHIRNLYAKYEVGNRREFADKMKNQPRD